METQRQWSAQAISRTTPAILGLYSIVTLVANELLAGQAMMMRHSAWYAKDSPTFSDTVALVRRSI
ncbi:hypothetical protein [Janthinobacterium sp. PSPC3-1]